MNRTLEGGNRFWADLSFSAINSGQSETRSQPPQVGPCWSNQNAARDVPSGLLRKQE